MRATSNRRRSEKASRALQPDDTLPPRLPRGLGKLAVEPGTEGARECPDCHTWVPLNSTGITMRSHAAGGWYPNVMKGHPPCPSSGHDAGYVPPAHGF